MKRKVGITVSAMLLATQLGSPAMAQTTSDDKLGAIAGYLENNQFEALRAFLQANPELLLGDTALAVLLREFMDDSGSITTYLGVEPDLRDALRDSRSGNDGFAPAAGLY